MRYSYLNFVPMGFETVYWLNILMLFYIWTLSLWDLKHSSSEWFFILLTFELCPYGIWNVEKVEPKERETDLNFVPMGFETQLSFRHRLFRCYLNFVPMGFETKSQIFLSWNAFIWTLSLWDLKHILWVNTFLFLSIWTLSLWDLKLTFAT